MRKQFGDSQHKVVEDKDLHNHRYRLLYLPSQPHFPVDGAEISWVRLNLNLNLSHHLSRGHPNLIVNVLFSYK